MARRGDIAQRRFVRDRIADDTRTGNPTMDNRIPIWNGEENVRCHQIRLPLNHLFLRLRNARTTDTQLAFISSNADFEHPLTGEIIRTPEEGVFEDERQFEQNSQNMQSVLLCIEANRRRENGKTLFETLREEGWRPREVPIITRDGVLINGNTRVAAIEALLNNGEEIEGITTENPQIDVRVIPNLGNGEQDINALENYLQKPDGARLNYNWYQDTTIINRRLNSGERVEMVHNDYKDLTRFETIPKMRKTLNSRVLVDDLFVSLGKEHQAILVNPNEHMIYAMQDQVSKDYISTDTEYQSKSRAVFAALTQLTLDSRAIGEMRYHVTRIKSAEDIDSFEETITEILPEIFQSETIEDDFGDGQYQLWSINSEVYGESREDQKIELAQAIFDLAEHMKARNKGEDEENAIVKRLVEAKSKITKSLELRRSFDGEYPREEDLDNAIINLGRVLRQYMEFRAD
jgi:hypothetical protein